MKARILCFMIALFPLLAQAELVSAKDSPVDSKKPPVQIFEQADSALAAAPALPVVTALPAAAPVIQPQVATLKHQQANSTRHIQDLEDQMIQLQQSYLLFQQETRQQVDVLQQKTLAIQAEIEQLAGVFKVLNQQLELNKSELNTHERAINHLSSETLTHFWTQLIQFFNNTDELLLLLSALVLLMLLAIVRHFRRHRKPPKLVVVRPSDLQSENHDSLDDTKNEYDFMGSSEGIPAQLDLARAYIAMENYAGARMVLENVSAKGDAEQRQEARDLLTKIPSGR